MRKDLPEGFEEQFWKTVIFLNLGPVSLAFGAMYVFFEGWSDVALAAFAVGGVSLFFATRSYFVAREMLAEESDVRGPEGADS